MTSVVMSVVEQLARAGTEPERNVLLLELRRTATPAELVAVARHPQTPRDIARAIDGYCRAVLPDGEKPVRCTRRPLAEHVNLYDSKEPRRVLLIGFCGRANLLFMPTAAHLQLLAPSSDLVLFGDPQQTGFTNGVYAYAPTLEAALERAGEAIDFSRYDELRTIGTSGGGAAALAAGRMLGATAMVSFGGRLPTRSRRYGDSPGALAIERILRKTPGTGRAYAVCAEGNDKDANNARLLGRAANAETIMVPGTDTHNTVHHLLQLGKLRSFFEEVGLLGPVAVSSRAAS